MLPEMVVSRWLRPISDVCLFVCDSKEAMHLDVRPIADIDVLQRCLKDINNWRDRVCGSL